MRRSGQSENPFKPTFSIVEDGPFRLTRNPMYLQMVITCVGFAVFLSNGWILALTPLCALALRQLAILPEERYLEEKFGDAYIAYKRRVRRWDLTAPRVGAGVGPWIAAWVPAGQDRAPFRTSASRVSSGVPHAASVPPLLLVRRRWCRARSRRRPTGAPGSGRAVLRPGGTSCRDGDRAPGAGGDAHRSPSTGWSRPETWSSPPDTALAGNGKGRGRGKVPSEVSVERRPRPRLVRWASAFSPL